MAAEIRAKIEEDKKEGPVDGMDVETKEEEKEEGEISESEDEEDKKEAEEVHEGKGKKRARPIENKRLIDFPRDSIVKKRLDYIIKTAMATPISDFMIKSASTSASPASKQSSIDKFVKREEEKKRKRSSDDEEEKGNSSKKSKIDPVRSHFNPEEFMHF